MFHTNLNQISDALTFRISELLSKDAPWHRRLHSTNYITKIDELIACADWSSRHVLTKLSVQKLSRELKEGAKAAPSLPTSNHKKRLIDLLGADFSANTPELEALKLLHGELNCDFWTNISTWVENSNEINLDLLAREVASKLLDDGFSPKKAQEIVVDLKGQTIGESLEHLRLTTKTPPQTYEFIFPVNFDKSQGGSVSDIPRYVSGNEFEDILQGPAPTAGAYRIVTQGRDVWAAGEAARQIAAKLSARIKFTNHPQQSLHEQFFETSQKVWHPTASPQRHARVNSLKTQGGIFDVLNGDVVSKSKNHIALDNALEMAMSLQSPNMSQVISGGWSALESLLRTTDKREATNYTVSKTAALIVSTSLPRAELTALANRINPTTNPGLRDEIMALTTNREKAQRLQAVLLENQEEVRTEYRWTHDPDQIALRRLKAALQNPTGYIKQTSQVIENTFEQFYRQRNIVTHGGDSGGQIMSASARISTPLVAAVLDRITHLTFTEDMGIREIVARIHHNVSRIDDLQPDLVGLQEGL